MGVNKLLLNFLTLDFSAFKSKKSPLREQDLALKDTFFRF